MAWGVYVAPFLLGGLLALLFLVGAVVGAVDVYQSHGLAGLAQGVGVMLAVMAVCVVSGLIIIAAFAGVGEVYLWAERIVSTCPEVQP